MSHQPAGLQHGLDVSSHSGSPAWRHKRGAQPASIISACRHLGRVQGCP
jgi:hypothetical protein